MARNPAGTRLMRGETIDFSGEHYQLAGARMDPLPINPSLPLMIGGGGEKRTLRIVARFADQWNFDGTGQIGDLAHKRTVLRHHCEDIGRNPDEIEPSVQLWAGDDTDALIAVLDRCGEAGADHAILAFPEPKVSQHHAVLEALDRAGY